MVTRQFYWVEGSVNGKLYKFETKCEKDHVDFFNAFQKAMLAALLYRAHKRCSLSFPLQVEITSVQVYPEARNTKDVIRHNGQVSRGEASPAPSVLPPVAPNDLGL